MCYQGSPRILELVVYPFSRGSFLTQKSSQGLLHCRQILYQLSYQGSPIKTGLLKFKSMLFPAVITLTHGAGVLKLETFSILRPAPVLLPGKSHGRRSLVGCSPWGRRELDTTERLRFHFHALEKEMAIHSSVLFWRIPGIGEPGGLPSMGSHRVGRD